VKVPHHVRVHHRRLDVGVAQVLLNLADVDAGEQQMGRKAVPERVDGRRFVDVRLRGRGLHGLLHDRLMHVVAADDAGARVG